MSHKRKSLHKLSDVPPDVGKKRSNVSIFASQSMHLRVPVTVIIRFWLD
jgi:hypothetical protein